MGGETIHINLAKPVDAVKLKAGVPNGQIQIKKCFGGFGLSKLVDLIISFAISATSNQNLKL